MFRATAPGKVILSGEHSVVYGYPALVAAVDRYIRLTIAKNRSGLEVEPLEVKKTLKSAVKKNVLFLGEDLGENFTFKINSDIPIGCGMGSSAAFAVTVSASILKYSKVPWSKKLVGDMAYEIERGYHGHPSGVDNTISLRGGYLWYRKESEMVKLFYQLGDRGKFRNFYIVNTGKSIESTGEMVARVRTLYESKKSYVAKIFNEIETVSRGFLRYFLKEETGSIADIIKQNQRLLEKLGVVSPFAKYIVKQIEKHGGAAKVSGAGGVKGASGILLVYHEDYDMLSGFLENHKLFLEKVNLGSRGLKIGKIN